MADEKQIAMLSLGLESWNGWRKAKSSVQIDLSGADLTGLKFGIDPAIRSAIAKGVIPQSFSWSFFVNEIVGYEVLPLDLRGANLRGARMPATDLRCADCREADFSGAQLREADLSRANLVSARFIGTDLGNAKMRAVDLSNAVLVQTNLDGANIGFSRVYGVSAWDIVGSLSDEENLFVSPGNDRRLTVDSLGLAQFVYYLINNENARAAIDTLTTKTVLILGSFNEERKIVLDQIRMKLRELGLVPIIFDFSVPYSKDVTGTVETLARISRFVMADLTDPSSVPHELATVTPFLRTTPVLMLRQSGKHGYSMANDLLAYPWVLDIVEYDSPNDLIKTMSSVIEPAHRLANKMRGL